MTTIHSDSKHLSGVTLGAIALLAALLVVSPSTRAQEGFAITRVTVVPMDSETILENQTVLITNNEIAAIVPAETAEIPQGYERIDGEGRFLAPGLADMHAHPMTQVNLDAFLANGITLIRSMWSEPLILRMREEIEQGERAGPRIIAGGRIVDGEPVIHYGSDLVLNSDDADRVVRKQKEAGYDFIKIYSHLSLEGFDAIAEASNGQGIPFAGHVPAKVPMNHALAAGMQTSEHMIGISEATLREGQQYFWPFDPEFVPFAERLGKGELTLDQLYDEQKLRDLAAQAAATGHWLVPTLIVLRGTALDPAQIATELQRPEIRYTDYTVKSFWQLMTTMGPPKSEAFYAGRRVLLDHDLHQLKAFHDAGARILAGTDALNPFVNVGFSLVQELELFVEAGMTPYEALKTATVNVAEFAGEPGKSGLVAAGARADLVLLDANPLENVTAYRGITGVFANGRWHDRKDLDQRLATMEAQSERKAQVFAADANWSLHEGEFVPMFAGFETFNEDEKTGTERIARAYTGETVSAMLAERRGDDGSLETLRMETNEAGLVTRLNRRTVVSETTADLEIERKDSGFEIRGPENAVRSVDSESSMILTHSALDALLLQPTMGEMADGETREIEVLCLEAGDALVPCTVTLTRHPAEVIIGHFYFSGVNPIDVRIESTNSTRNSRFMMGGGFYTGWPVTLELGQPASAAPLHYRRIL